MRKFVSRFHGSNVRYNVELEEEIHRSFVLQIGDVNNWYTIQCILPFNLFTKRIFVLLLIWFSVLLVLNLIDFIFVWLYQRVYSSAYRYEYIFRLVHIYKSCLCKSTSTEQNDCGHFRFR